MMEYRADPLDAINNLAQLFHDTFAAAEGPDEGKIVGDLATGLMETTPKADLFAFSAYDGDKLAGCILFTRLTYSQDSRTAFLLSPVAIRTDLHRQGIGQKLIGFGLDHLRKAGVDLAFTYGDPNYYGKTGFQPISQHTAPAPYPLQMPQGWLAQSLTDALITPLIGPCTCAPALRQPAVW